METRRRAGIVSTGKALPVCRLTNFDLEYMVETSDEWITARTGIRERRIITGAETNSSLSETAPDRLERAAEAGRIDMLIVATVTADQLLPSSACLIQARLNAYKAATFDLAAGCTGFFTG